MNSPAVKSRAWLAAGSCSRLRDRWSNAPADSCGDTATFSSQVQLTARPWCLTCCFCHSFLKLHGSISRPVAFTFWILIIIITRKITLQSHVQKEKWELYLKMKYLVPILSISFQQQMCYNLKELLSIAQRGWVHSGHWTRLPIFFGYDCSAGHQPSEATLLPFSHLQPLERWQQTAPCRLRPQYDNLSSLPAHTWEVTTA